MIGVICHPEPVPPLHDMFNKLDNDEDEFTKRVMASAEKDLDSLLSEADDLFKELLRTSREARNRVKYLSGL